MGFDMRMTGTIESEQNLKKKSLKRNYLSWIVFAFFLIISNIMYVFEQVQKQYTNSSSHATVSLIQKMLMTTSHLPPLKILYEN